MPNFDANGTPQRSNRRARSVGGTACAVVVTYRPQPEVRLNLELLRAELDCLVVVDNTPAGEGPAGSGREMLMQASREVGFTLLENGENQGIAAALNRGIGWAERMGHGWVFLFDQDSSIVPGFVAAMFVGHALAGRRDPPAVCFPRYFDRESGVLMRAVKDRAGEIQTARTSGSLMPMWVFRECGLFDEQMIIDQVDYEYCLRLAEMGLRVVECAGATLLHTLGSPVTHRVFGVRLFRTTNHSAARRYYLTRNRVWLVRKYWKRYPLWCLQAFLATLKESLKILLVENRRWLKLHNTGLGIRDGVAGRMGMTVRL